MDTIADSYGYSCLKVQPTHYGPYLLVIFSEIRIP